jgi:hypothetical protein
MSEKIAAAKALSFSTSDEREKINSKGEKIKVHLTRDTTIQRPDKVWADFKGDLTWKFWYDGKYLTAVSDKEKVFVQKAVPHTIDEMLDYLAERLNLLMPISDLLYSNPYQSFMTPDTKGGLVGTEDVEGESCSHVSYHQSAADWQVWISNQDSLPRKVQIKYLEEPAQPEFVIILRNWNLNPAIPENTFAFKIPDGYERIPIMERVEYKEPGKSTQTQTNKKP